MASDDASVTDRVTALERVVAELRQAVLQLAEHAQRLETGLRSLAEHVDAVAAHSDGLAPQIDELVARTWDQVAIARRPADLEDHVTELLAAAEAPA